MANPKLEPTETDAILSLDPNAKFSHSWNGTLTWLPEHSGTPPTDTAIANELTRLKEIFNNASYQRTRSKNYKPIDEQLDQLYHDMLAGKLDATGEWAKSVKSVKDATPKP